MPFHRRKAKLLVLGAGIALLAALTAAGTLLLREDPAERKALLTRGAIVGMTTGADPLVLGAAWQKVLLRMAPSLSNRVGGIVVVPTGVTGESLVVWRSMGRLEPFQGFSVPALTGTLTGDDDETMDIDRNWKGDWHLVGEGELEQYVISNYPRRGKEIHLHLLPPEGDAVPAADFVVMNPAPGAYPNWEPDPASTVHRSGGLEVACQRFVTGSAHYDRQRGWVRQAALDLRLQENGKGVASGWRVEEVTISDATGNRWVRSNGTVEGSGAHLRYGLFDLRIPRETAYRVRVALARCDRFPAEDLWVVRGLPMPAAGKSISVGREVKRHGYSLRLRRVVGAGGRLETTANGWTAAGRPTAVLGFSGPADRFYLRSRSIARGQSEEYSPYDKLATPELSLGMPGKNGLAALELAITPRREVEFLVAPTPLAEPGTATTSQ